MSTIRVRGDKFQAIVRIKEGGAIVHQEARSFSSRKLAKDWAERLEADLKVKGVPQRQLATTTLAALLMKYLDTLLAHKPIRRTREAELHQLAPYFDKTPLSACHSAAVFSEFATKRRAEGAGATTVMHNLAVIRSALNSAKAMYGLHVTGAGVGEAIVALKRLGVVQPSNARERRPTQSELDAMMREFERVKHHPSSEVPMHIILPLAIALPRRLGELTSMTWGDFNQKTKLVTLRDTKHPTKPRDEIVPVPPAAFEIMRNLPVIDAYLLPYQATSVSASFQRCCKRLGIVDLHFHDLRHEGISRLFEAGLAIQEVALISGHQSWTMLRRYTHPSVTALAEKMNAGISQTQEAAP